jgi:hypothetical protein
MDVAPSKLKNNWVGLNLYHGWEEIYFGVHLLISILVG